jgi:hypothetical protein
MMPRPRRSRDDLRTLLLEEGRAIVADEGLLTESGNLTFKRVFDRVEARTGERITNASVIRRVWANQSEFQTDVLVAIAHDGSRPEIGGTIEALGEVLDGIDLSTVASRERALCQVCRVGGNAFTAVVTASTNWSLWVSVIAMAASATVPEQQQRIRAAITESYESASTFWNDTLGALVTAFGLRPRPGYDLRQFVMSVTAHSEGCALRQRTTDHIETVIRPTGTDGEGEEWTLFAVGLEGLVHQFLEPDPDAAHAA